MKNLKHVENLEANLMIGFFFVKEIEINKGASLEYVTCSTVALILCEVNYIISL